MHGASFSRTLYTGRSVFRGRGVCTRPTIACTFGRESGGVVTRERIVLTPPLTHRCRLPMLDLLGPLCRFGPLGDAVSGCG